MGLYKLREWVGTVTGKGDRWGRDRVGRSEPAFLAANTFALPPLTCTVRQEAGRLHLRPLFLLRGRPFVLRPVPGGESAGCVCLQCFVLRAVCLPCSPFACHTHCPAQQFAPVRSTLPRPVILLCLPPFISMCARIVLYQTNSLQAARTVPLAAATRACSGGPCAGSFVDSYPFSCRVHDPGPWV